MAPYEQRAKRGQPGLFVFLLDQSWSMHDPWGASTEGKTKSQGVAEAVNATLSMIVDRCKPDSYEVRHYYDIAVIGYGSSVGSALPEELGGKLVVSTPELFDTQRINDAGESWWIEPINDNGTPMGRALDVAGGLIWKWVEQHRNSFPPVLINISDGMPNEDETGTVAWADRIQKLATSDGNVLVFNVHISGRAGGELLYPADRAALPDEYARLLFDMSSPLPPFMSAYLAREGISVQEGAKAFVYNGKPSHLIKALEIGTRSGASTTDRTT